MRYRHIVLPVALAGALVCTLGAPAAAGDQRPESGTSGWTPPRLGDGQPDIQGMWNNADSNHTPLELPDELRALAKARYDGRIAAGRTHTEGTVGFYALYWWDWHWSDPVGGDWPALLVEPKSGKMPPQTEQSRNTAAYMREHLHDTYANMEPGDRCISRGVLGMMLPAAYNNGTLILQAPGYGGAAQQDDPQRPDRPDRRGPAYRRADRALGRQPARPLGGAHAGRRID